MGTGLFDYIAQACQSLADSTAPSITAMGTHIVLALATIMLVWFGVQESLASAHGGPGFNMARFLNLFMLLTFAYVKGSTRKQVNSLSVSAPLMNTPMAMGRRQRRWSTGPDGTRPSRLPNPFH